MSSTDETWQPDYSPWRHGGWYVNNVRHPSGAVGCVSRNYPDRKWRIVCDPRPFDTAPAFPSRDAAARAERELAQAEMAAHDRDTLITRFLAAPDHQERHALAREIDKREDSAEVYAEIRDRINQDHGMHSGLLAEVGPPPATIVPRPRRPEPPEPEL